MHRYLLIMFFLINPAQAAHDNVKVCKQEYVLCTSAPCIPDPRHSNYAICSCDVENGYSAGYKTCVQRAAKIKSFKVKQLISTFSFEQFKSKKSMNCPQGKPWTDCVDAPCTVDPMNASKAICSCQIKHDQPFVTFGGDCNMNTCSTGFWSGSMSASSATLRASLLDKLHSTKNPWTDIRCVH